MPESELKEHVRTLVAERLGVTFSPEHDRWLFDQLQESARKYGHGSLDRFVTQLRQRNNKDDYWQDVIHAITVHETHWMRYKAPALRALEGLGTKVEKIQFLSVGCSYGPEVYSTFLLARHLHPQAEITGEGMDISNRCLEIAREGEYPVGHSTEQLKPFLEESDLEYANESSFRFSAAIRSRLSFSEANIVYTTAIPVHETFDLILCQNCLTYYSLDTRKTVSDRLAKYLPPGGMLLFSGAELQGYVPAGTVQLEPGWPQIFVKGF